MVALRVGYTWFPLGRDSWVHLRPWAGVGTQTIVAGTFEPGVVTPETVVGGVEYVIDTVVPFASVHTGVAL